MTDQEKKDNEASPASEAKSDTHPMCENASDKDKCVTSLERLGEASNNIDPKKG